MWAGIDKEVEGVATAARNGLNDDEALARYVYDRCCDFGGIDHEGISTRLIAAAITASRGEPANDSDAIKALADRVQRLEAKHRVMK